MNEHYLASNKNFHRLQVHQMPLWVSNIQHSIRFYVVSCSHCCFHIVVLLHKFIRVNANEEQKPQNKCWLHKMPAEWMRWKVLKCISCEIRSIRLVQHGVWSSLLPYICRHWMEKLFNRTTKWKRSHVFCYCHVMNCEHKHHFSVHWLNLCKQKQFGGEIMQHCLQCHILIDTHTNSTEKSSLL